jgi:hypothetical protein
MSKIVIVILIYHRHTTFIPKQFVLNRCICSTVSKAQFRKAVFQLPRHVHLYVPVQYQERYRQNKDYFRLTQVVIIPVPRNTFSRSHKQNYIHMCKSEHTQLKIALFTSC